ncbi:MAG TPA: hypothetical protein PKH33_08165, partial [bacterium]|nr:hypothetical protein [bacterium]
AVRADRTITAGTGLSGGGDLTANRTISLNTTYTDGLYVLKAGDTMTGNLVISRADAEEATISLYGASQGTGRVFVGQSTTYGGGIIYNGDGTPASSTTTDAISIYRRTAGVDTEVLHWMHNSDVAYFHGSLNMGGFRVENIGAPNSTDDAVHAGRSITLATSNGILVNSTTSQTQDLTANRTYNLSLDKSHTNCAFSATTTTLSGTAQDTTCAAGFCAIAAVNGSTNETEAAARHDNASLYFGSGVPQFATLKVLCCPCQ